MSSIDKYVARECYLLTKQVPTILEAWEAREARKDATARKCKKTDGAGPVASNPVEENEDKARDNAGRSNADLWTQKNVPR